MFRSTEMAHLLIRQRLQPGDWAIDATLGNGHDALFLSQMVGGEGHVFAFDPQPMAHAATRLMFAEQGVSLENVTLFERGHETMAESLKTMDCARLRCVMFNLGYLPGGDKEFITKPETTLAALEQAAGLLSQGGLLSVVIYPGHEGGAAEGEAVMEKLRQLPAPWKLYTYQCVNTKMPAPYLAMAVKGG